MKSIKEIAWDVTEPEYKKDPAASYSTLARFEREGWRNLSHLNDRVETPSLLFGSVVDCILTEGEEAFKDRFMVCSFPAISETLAGIARSLYSLYGETHKRLATISDEDISEVAVSHGYYAGASYKATRIKKVRESCSEYYSLLVLGGDKTVLSQDDYDDAVACVHELRENPGTHPFFNVNPWEKEIEKVFQLKFKATWNGIPVRCMMDLLIVDHANKVLQPVDLKTTGHPEEEFENSFSQWRYDIQGKLYSYILQENIQNDPYFKDFRIDPYLFIVINRRTVAPVVWRFDKNFSSKDLVDSEGKVHRDWRKILSDLDYYRSNPMTRYSKEVMKNKGVMLIKNLKEV